MVHSPMKPRLSKSASFSGAPSRPGAATKRSVPAKARPSLKQAMNDERRSESRGPNRPISLLRSATAPSIPGLKREVSEVPSLFSIPSTESQPLQASRGGVLSSKRFAQREVDMSLLIARDFNTKAKKQAIDFEVKDAIMGLRRPNRELQGKSLAETAEKRSSLTSSNIRSE